MEDSGKFTIKTFVKHDDVIVQETRDMVGRISKKIVETQDDQVRKALISLGWTPPSEKRLMEPQPAPVAWMYLGEPDFDGTAWRENWQVTTSRQVATFKAQPNQPVPLVPAVQPVSVSERPWERAGWCDEQGRCWALNEHLPAWEFHDCADSRKWADLFLPAHALPLPVEVEHG